MRYIVVLLTLALTACGVDGEPDRPDPPAGAPGVSLTGTVSVGISGSN